MMHDEFSFLMHPLGLILLLVGLAILPFVAMMVTSYIKLSVVMNLVRQAMGLQQVPPNMIINGLALVLTLYIMAPVLQEMFYRGMNIHTMLRTRKQQPRTFQWPTNIQAFMPSNDAHNNSIPPLQTVWPKDTSLKPQELQALFGYGKQPLVGFLIHHSTAKHRSFFVPIAKRLWPAAYAKNLQDSDLLICVPAFVLSELTAAFAIGFLIYLPFIAIDLVVSNILLAMGMMMVSPMTISLPIKLMLFVLVDGWDKLVEALALTYR